MLSTIGVGSIRDLFKDIKSVHAPKSFDLPEGRSEFEVMEYVRMLAGKNASALTLFVGGGYYDHFIPSVIPALISRGEFLTAYTPYQPECSQGTLQALYEYQSGICALTGMDAANASLYDGGTALYEAMMMSIRLNGRQKIIMDGCVSPIFRKIIWSYTHNLNIEFVEVDPCDGQSDRKKIFELLDKKTAGIILQNPNFFGVIDDHTDIVQKAHAMGAIVIQSVYPVALGLIKTPGEMGVDIVTGEGQSLGLSLSFGGPYLGFMAVKKAHIRKMPGRVVGETVDHEGRRCFVNTLQAREQHIRREKATSNICTNVALCAVQASMYMALMGRQGFRDLAQLNLDKTEYMKKRLAAINGVNIKKSLPTFNEFTVCLPVDAVEVVSRMIDHGFAAGFPLGRYYKDMSQHMIVAVTEKRTKEEIDRYAGCLEDVLSTLKCLA
jgi:glycine dehydrogenase subunit 1